MDLGSVWNGGKLGRAGVLLDRKEETKSQQAYLFLAHVVSICLAKMCIFWHNRSDMFFVITSVICVIFCNISLIFTFTASTFTVHPSYTTFVTKKWTYGTFIQTVICFLIDYSIKLLNVQNIKTSHSRIFISGTNSTLEIDCQVWRLVWLPSIVFDFQV